MPTTSHHATDRRRQRLALGVTLAVHLAVLLSVVLVVVTASPEPQAKTHHIATMVERTETPSLTLELTTIDATPPPQSVSAKPHPKPKASAPISGTRPRTSPIAPSELDQRTSSLIARATPKRMAVQEVVQASDVEPVEHRSASVPKLESTLPGTALHGELPEGRSITYLLDRSSSLGTLPEGFRAARGSIVSTLSALPANTNVQVVIYNSRAEVTLKAKPNDRELQVFTKRLEDLKAEGRSHHRTGLEAALLGKPDFLVWLTDAADDELDELKAVLKQAGTTTIYLARIDSRKVQAPVVWK